MTGQGTAVAFSKLSGENR